MPPSPPPPVGGFPKHIPISAPQDPACIRQLACCAFRKASSPLPQQSSTSTQVHRAGKLAEECGVMRQLLAQAGAVWQKKPLLVKPQHLLQAIQLLSLSTRALPPRLFMQRMCLSATRQPWKIQANQGRVLHRAPTAVSSLETPDVALRTKARFHSNWHAPRTSPPGGFTVAVEHCHFYKARQTQLNDACHLVGH